MPQPHEHERCRGGEPRGESAEVQWQKDVLRDELGHGNVPAIPEVTDVDGQPRTVEVPGNLESGECGAGLGDERLAPERSEEMQEETDHHERCPPTTQVRAITELEEPLRDESRQQPAAEQRPIEELGRSARPLRHIRLTCLFPQRGTGEDGAHHRGREEKPGCHQRPRALSCRGGGGTEELLQGHEATHHGKGDSEGEDLRGTKLPTKKIGGEEIEEQHVRQVLAPHRLARQAAQHPLEHDRLDDRDENDPERTRRKKQKCHRSGNGEKGESPRLRQHVRNGERGEDRHHVGQRAHQRVNARRSILPF